jgi:hypothetical protein
VQVADGNIRDAVIAMMGTRRDKVRPGQPAHTINITYS